MITVRRAVEADADEIAGLLVGEMYPEVGKALGASLDPQATALGILQSINGEGAYIARSENCRLIGVLNLIRTQWWFSRDEFIADQGFFVSKPFRPRAGALLLKAARQHAAKAGLPCFIFRFNPGRSKGRVADRVQIHPAGEIVKL